MDKSSDALMTCLILQSEIAEEIKREASNRGITNGAAVVLVFKNTNSPNDLRAALPTIFAPAIAPFATFTSYYTEGEYENYIGVALEKMAKMLRTGETNRKESFIRIMSGTQRRRIEDLTVIGENSFKGGFPYKSELFFAIVALASKAPDQNDNIIDAVLPLYGFDKVV